MQNNANTFSEINIFEKEILASGGISINSIETITGATALISKMITIFDTSSGTILAERSFKWNDTMSALHIFLLETWAAVEGLAHAKELSGQSSFFIMTDNTAVAGCLKRYYSTNEVANKWMRRIWDLDLWVIGIASADNEADPLSRNLAGCRDLRKILRLIEEDKCGRRSGESNMNRPKFDGNLRHPEEDSGEPGVEMFVEFESTETVSEA